MRTRVASILALVAGTYCGLTSLAQAEDKTTVVFTPRLWYSFVSASEVYPGAGASVSHTPMALYGASLAVVPANWGGTTLSLTAFYGNGNGNYDEGSGCCVFSGSHDVTRFDVEAVAQFPLGNAGAFWSLGLRYILADSKAAGTDLLAQPFNFDTKNKHYLGELGFGASTPLNSSGTHRFFGGLTFLAGIRDVEATNTCCAGPIETFSATDGVVGIDTNFGYAATLGPAATFYARYRLFVLSEIGNFGSPDNLDVVHGPEVNLSIKLN